MTPALLSLAVLASVVGQTDTSTDASPPFTPEQLEWLKKMRVTEPPPPAPEVSATSALEIKADAYFKWLYRNNTTQGCVTYGNPHPLGDNFTGDNGACPELGLTIIGRPFAQLEGGFRLQSRFGQQFADYFENGDKREVPDASSESLGQNHSAHVQLRGIYVRIARPLPGVDWFLAGSSDLGHFDPWTVGKIRFIERFNAKGLFLQTSIGDYVGVLVSRIALSKLFGTANYNGLEEPLVTNPFWARDAIYATSITSRPGLSSNVSYTLNGALVLDEEADVNDPDAPGSTNTIDAGDGVTAVAARFLAVNASFEVDVTGYDNFRATALVALSHNRPNQSYVTNLSLGGLGFSNVVYDQLTDLAATARVEFPDLLFSGSTLHFEYFNIGANFNAVVGARREADVLLTDGFMDGGQVPTLNVANELIDFSDRFYESVVGWHGGTALLEGQSDTLDFGLEGTFITYNTNLQNRNMDVYPGFGGFTGYTDTQLFSYANTNDRGRDPRMVYQRDQDRLSIITMARATVKPGWWRGAELSLKAKYILDVDQRDLETDADDYLGNLVITELKVAAQPLDQLTVALGTGFDAWFEDGRSGTYAGGEPRFLDYETTRVRPYLDLRYALGTLSAGYHLEVVTKRAQTSNPALDVSTGLIWRSIGWLSAQF